jgi:phosphate acyltransferase
MPDNERVNIAVDAMGGDGGCRVVVEGAVRALSDDEGLVLHLVGNRSDLESALSSVDARLRGRIRLHDADSVLPMDVSTARALRQGQGSSMQLSLELLVAGEVQAVVSAGNTGALMALSRQVMGMLPGIERPALMASVPGAGKLVWVLDLGANVGVDAHRLLEFARLGHFAVQVLTGKTPRTGLLNIGHEPSKGPDVLREAGRLIEAERTIDYAGFVEADAVFAGAVDLVVCDGFAGNVLLKSAEGMVRLVFDEIDRGLGRGPTGWLARRRLRSLHDRLDPAMHNGAPLLGIRGTVIKSHGAACVRGVAAAVRLAALEARRDLIPELESRLWASY